MPPHQPSFALVCLLQDKSGFLGPAEFKEMLRSTVCASMESLLKTEEGQVSFTAHMEDEYSVENIEFYNATGEFQEHSTATFMGRVAPEELMAQGVAILELYVKSSAEKEVNISAGKQAAIVAAFEAVAASASERCVAPTVFDAARDEVRKLMEQDNFGRFSKNAEKMGAMVDKFFADADSNNDGKVSKEEYHRWAEVHPEAVEFINTLHESKRRITNKCLRAHTVEVETRAGNAAGGTGETAEVKEGTKEGNGGGIAEEGGAGGDVLP